MYQFKTEPFDHQRKALEGSWSAKFHAYFMEMGTGKSKVAIDNMGILYDKGEITAALIVAPKGVYDNWALGEIPLHLSESVNRKVLSWKPTMSKRYAAELEEMIMEDFDDPLDLLDDDGDGVVEMCLFEEEDKLKKGGSNNNSGCCLVIFAIGLSGFLFKYIF